MLLAPGRQPMNHDQRWRIPLLWLVLMGFAFSCGVIVIEHAFDVEATAIGSDQSYMHADYSADPRAVRAQGIAPVDRAVIGDTIRDRLTEQAYVRTVQLEALMVWQVAVPQPLIAQPQSIVQPVPSNLKEPAANHLIEASPRTQPSADRH